MRVAIVTESFLPTLNGVTNSVHRVSEYLRDNGHDVLIIAPQVPGTQPQLPGIGIHRVPSLAYRDFPVGLPHPLVSALLKSFQPDILHAASPFLLGYQALLAAGRADIPSVAVFQTDIAGYAKRNNLAATEAFAWWAVGRIHNAAQLTLCPSSLSRQQLHAAGVRDVAHWGRGVDIQSFHPRHRTDRHTLDLRRSLGAPNKVVVGYVGRLAPEKNVERLRALAELPNIHVLVVGGGPSENSVRRALRALPHTMAGPLRGHALHRAYAAMDIFVHTGEEETFGQTLQEAHASGLPVVAPAIGGPLELVDDGVDGLLYPPGDDEGLLGAVQALVSSATSRAQMGEAGRRKVLGRDWATVCDELMGHYRRVMVGQMVRQRLMARSQAA